MALNAPVWLTGYEHRQLVAAAAPNSGLFGNIAGSPTIDTSVVAPGGSLASLKVDSSAAAHTVGVGLPFAAGTYFAGCFQFRVSSAVALAGTPAATIMNAVNANGNLRIDLMNTGALRVFGATGSVSTTSSTILANDQWYRILFEFDARSNPATVKLFIVDTQEEISVSASQVSVNVTALNQGNASVAGGLRSILNFDDYIVYNAVGDYALLKTLGPFSICGLNPVGVGTHSTPGNFQDEASVALTGGDTTSWNKIDDLPSVPDTSTYVKQVTSTGYLEYKMAQPPVGVSVIAARAIMVVFSSTTVANNMSFRSYDGTTESGDIQSATVGSTTIVYRGGMFPHASGGSWSIQDWVAQTARFRIGYSSDISPVPQITAAMIELAVGMAAPNNQKMYGPLTETRRTSWLQ